ncbi:MAG: IPT/TIG domain-containing protein [Candidatus Acidiferrales bacterium]
MRTLQGKSRLALWCLVFVAVVLPSCGNQYINNPLPILNSLSPASVQAEQPQFTLTVIGNDFTPSSLIEWNGQPIATIFVDVHTMTAQISPALLQNPGTVQITVFTQQPGGGTSVNILNFTITAKPSGVPIITSLSPTNTLAGNTGLDVYITGTNFVTQSVVTVNNANTTPTFINSTQLVAFVPAASMAAAGTVQITVVNPPPGGGASNTSLVTVTNPIPIITAVSPTSALVGGTPPALTITGTGMTAGSSILFNGKAYPTTFAGSTSVSANLQAVDLVNSGVNQVQVSNPSPGGGASNILTFAVNPTAATTTFAGLPYLVDVAPNGDQASNGICGGAVPPLSPCINGTYGLTYTNSGPSVSNTGQYVAFASISNNLVAGDKNTSSEIFYRNTCLSSASCTPLTTIVSSDVNGDAANNASFEPSISSAGSDVAFTSLATNLVTSVALNGTTRQIFWRPPCTSVTGCSATANETELLSISADGSSPGNGDSYNPSISPDGRFVTYVSLATNLVSNVLADGVTPQVYLTDTCSSTAANGTCTPTTYLISTPDGSTPGNEPSSSPSVSSGGTYVTFVSQASNLGKSAPNSSTAQEVFLNSPCVVTQTGCVVTTQLISTPDGITPANGTSGQPAISSTGRFVTFASTGTNLVVGVGPTQQIFVRDLCTGEAVTLCAPATALVSTSDGTTPANAISEHPSISTTGQFIAFASRASNLAPSVGSGVENVFARNTCATIVTSTTVNCATGTVLVSVPNPTPPVSNGDSLAPVISGNGLVAAFLSLSSNLVLRDDNNLEDIFLGGIKF